MLDVLEIVRIRFAGRPLLLWLALSAVFLIVRRGEPTTASRQGLLSAERLMAVLCSSALVAYLVLSIWYASDPHFFDNAEPTIPAVGWVFHVGGPIYHAGDSPERYSHIYGPLAFIAHGLALAVVGPEIRVSKMLGVVAGAGSLAIVYLLSRTAAQTPRAIVVTGLCALEFLLFKHYSYWTRPDPLEALAVALSLLAAVSPWRFTSAALTGVVAGFAWDLKFTAALYTLPAFALLARRGWRTIAFALGLASAVAVAPFVVFSNVSFSEYVFWSERSARTGLLLSTLRENIEWALFLAAPAVLSYFGVPRTLRPTGPAWRAVAGGTVLCLTGIVIAAAKPGAGAYHLLPCVPAIAYLVVIHTERIAVWSQLDVVSRRAGLAFLVVAGVIALAQNATFVRVMHDRRARDEIRDVTEFAASHQGVIDMGYGSTEAMSLERPVLVFRNNSYFLDQPAVREHQLTGMEIPQSTVAALEQCRVKYWLIPKGEAPFSGRNVYAAAFLRPLFSGAFRQAFLRAHVRIGTTRYYDVWECRGLT